jgi:putative GTP pyrophosphokinase
MLPSSDLTKSQVDRLGDRLRKGDISEDDLRVLDSYRRSFSDAYEIVVGQIRDQLGLEPTGRPAKSTTSIIDKLQRESIRLSQVQDIGGCRLTTRDIDEQDYIVTRLTELFDKATIVDRREQSSHGYRAVHAIVDSEGKLIEIQVRTEPQHLWAELSEKLSDVVDNSIKYGGGPIEIATPLAKLSDKVKRLERTEGVLQTLLRDDAQLRSLMQSGRLSHELSQEAVLLTREVERIRKNVLDERQAVIDIMKTIIGGIQEIK